ncbi:MAG: NAD(P)-binding protein [Planctomycetota bacterium]
MTNERDRELGMDRPIDRRDFLNGMALAAAGIVALPRTLLGFELAALRTEDGKAPNYYPPALTGLRGSPVGSFEAFHALKDGEFWRQHAGEPNAVDAPYDLVVVGGGISGLAAAYYFMKSAPPNARALILDNHDDFGGHATRNEFTHEGRTHIGYGGAQAIESPAPYSKNAKSLISDLGIDVTRYESVASDEIFYALGLKSGYFFDRATFGSDRLVAGASSRPTAEFLQKTPLSERAQRDLIRLTTEPLQPFPDLAPSEIKARLARMSYAEFLTKHWSLDPMAIAFHQMRTHDLFGVGIDAVPAQDAWGLGLPGFRGLNLDRKPGPGQNHDSIRHPEADDYYFHFPDGNATIARLLVRRLIPGAIPGNSMDDIVTARANYARLDEPKNAARLRLNSTVVRVRHNAEPARAKHVEVTYLRNGKLEVVTGKTCVLACWHNVIPYICAELPPKQKAALAYAPKVPLVHTNVLVRNWQPFVKLGVHAVMCPGLWHTSVQLDFRVSIGDYQCVTSPDQPIVLHLVKTPCAAGLTAPEQHRAGRLELLGTSFETIERSIREDLTRILAPGGFDSARDILAITVNRWAHGYAYQYNSLYDPFWLVGGEAPCVVARAGYGRIAIANADAAAYSYADAAIDQAHRAVEELLPLLR